MLRLLTIVVLASFVPAVLAGHDARAADAPAGEPAVARPFPGLQTKWHDMQTRMAEDAIDLAACRLASDICSPQALLLQGIIQSARAHDGRARLGHINRAVNLAIRPASDLRRFGTMDRWSPPLETMQTGAGDCEDYALVKLLALREAGFAAADLKLVIVHDAKARADHAVAAARIAGQWLILDNRGFALIDLDRSRYRVLAQFSPGTDDIASGYASTAISDPILM